ncbi:hypothetical protein Tco_1566399, partial [Tanacetum coccineum]
MVNHGIAIVAMSPCGVGFAGGDGFGRLGTVSKVYESDRGDGSFWARKRGLGFMCLILGVGIHLHMGGSYYPIPCSILSTGKDRKTLKRYPDVPTTSWRISIRSMDLFQGLT